MSESTHQAPDRNLAMELVRVTEAAALAAGPVPDPTLPLLNTVAAALARLPPP